MYKKNLEDFLIEANELLKSFQDSIPIEFLTLQNKKTYFSLANKLQNYKVDEMDVKDLIRLSEIILLFSKGELLLLGAKIYLNNLCCFKHEEEDKTLTLYLPSFWILSIIHKIILSKNKRKNNLFAEMYNFVINSNLPTVPKERLKMRIKEYIRRENEKTLFDFADCN